MSHVGCAVLIRVAHAGRMGMTTDTPGGPADRVAHGMGSDEGRECQSNGQESGDPGLARQRIEGCAPSLVAARPVC